ncbi:hypothetical protein HHK36_018455 [Tetracentron sinense]|uniref:peptidylprolyl isomerase n=1 Tax=Tetracentron sinense TaxID=13715 RepID=A0A834YYR8_TETSI|nr:hypothetical protein HHK36_018455 [Tetracentron sinense]
MAVDEVAEQEFVDQKKKTSSEDEKRRKKIVPGSLMKAMIRSGGGTAKPADGDQVIFHCTIRTLDGVIVESTRSDYGSKGNPIRHVLGKSKMILGLLEGIPTMLRGEVAMVLMLILLDFFHLIPVGTFKMKPELHYGEVDCPVAVSESFPKNDDLNFEIELIDFFKIKARNINFNVIYTQGIKFECILAIYRFIDIFYTLMSSTGCDVLMTVLKVISDDLGVVKKVINEGQGWEMPREPYEVKAWIAAKAGDGKMILSLTQEPFFFTFGKAEVPKGLEMGIGTMTRGEKAILYVTNCYLTQSPFMPVVDGFDEIHFEVELVHFTQVKSVRDMLGDGRLIKRRIHDGRGVNSKLKFKLAGLWDSEFPMDCPLHDSLLSVHYKGMLLDEEMTVFYDTRIDNNGQPLEFSSGEGLVPEGLEMCVRLMLPGEIALVTCPPDYAYDKFARPANVPEGAHIQWEIELLGFEMPKDWAGLSFKNIMDEVEKIKGTGNRLFKEGKFELAKAKYEKASLLMDEIMLLDIENCNSTILPMICNLQVLREYNHVNPQNDEEGKVFLNSRNLLQLNVAACYLKVGECRKSIETCNKVLDANPVHVKALYRRGMAYMSAGDFEEARMDFTKMISIDKSSEPDATAALLKLTQKEQEVERKARKQFKGLFDKKPGEIAEVDVVREDQNPKDENHEGGDWTEADGEEVEGIRDAAAAPPPVGLLSQFGPVGRRLFRALGLQKCSIL